MNRRGFIGRLAASLAGAVAASKVTGRDQAFSLEDKLKELAPETPIEDAHDELIPPVDHRIVGIAMESAQAGDLVTMSLMSFHGPSYVHAARTETPTAPGDFMVMGSEGRVRRM